MESKFLLEDLYDKVVKGGQLTEEEAYALESWCGDPRLQEYAEKITDARCTKEFDSCSIINARSGKCSENCKWCAQSAHHHTNCESYQMVDHDECMAMARHNHQKGVKRFSLVASGRSVKGLAFNKMCSMLEEVKREVGISTCASLGLIGSEEMKRLHAAGVNRYHCNLETAPSHFATLCTTHTVEDKIATLLAAKAEGMEVCSGGIIGMGENMKQRIELALALRRVEPHSIPINVLSPIKGTPLENTPLISEQEILDTIAIFRFIHPDIILRFAGGRARMSRDNQLKALKIGMNGAVTGDLLTTTGSTIDSDRQLVCDAGYNF